LGVNVSKNYSNPWATGPIEILKHALNVLENDSDADRRIAMILTDNAVEQTIKTFLSLPKRVTGISISRKKREEAFEYFPVLLDTLEEVASSKLEGVDLGVIEWYHRLRNELYHQGFGLSIEREKVEIYAELAQILLKNLFGETLPAPTSSDKATLLGRFLEGWNRLDKAITSLANSHSNQQRQSSLFDAARFLHDTGMLEPEEYYEINELRKLRNTIVHNQEDYKKVLTERIVYRVEELATLYDEVSNGA
jgi:hypothetical protein